MCFSSYFSDFCKNPFNPVPSDHWILALVTTAVISRSPSRASISVMFSLSIFSPIHWTSADYVATYKHVAFGKERRSNYDANGFFVFSFPDFVCDLNGYGCGCREKDLCTPGDLVAGGGHVVTQARCQQKEQSITVMSLATKIRNP